MSNGEPSTNGWPTWAKIGATLGFPVLVALFFMAKEVGYFPSLDTANASILTSHTRLLEHLNDQHEDEQRSLRQVIGLLRVICHNLAESPLEHDRCARVDN